MSIPPALLGLLFIAGAFAADLSTNDPFRVFSLQLSRHPKFPVCCLKPLSPHDTVQDQVLLSFEEWKAKQRESNGSTVLHRHLFGADSGHELMSPGNDSGPKKGESIALVQNASSFTSDDFFPQSHFRVPITDRFNYASLDCSARVHTAHRSAKSPSAVLDSKRDRYMLSPCKPANSEKQFVAVELCEDIRIDTVQLANFEFFSGVFKEFSVRVAKTYTTEGEGWVDAGSYRAKNVRGVQSFHLPTSLRDFYRFIRIDFRSHYGNEYYCPVSLLRVYGLTHLEEYKWEQWEEESRAKLGMGPVSGVQAHDEQAVDTRPEATQTIEFAGDTTASTHTAMPSQQHVSEDIQLEHGSGLSSATPAPTHTQTSIPYSPDCLASNNESPFHDLHNTHSELPRSLFKTNSDVSFYPITVDSHISTDTPLSISTVYPSISSSGTFSEPSSTQPSQPLSSPSYTSSHAMVNIATPSMPVVSQAASTSGESIYRVIMNRLTALEANHTLYVRYVEQQNTAVRELLKRLGEDVGRLEGIGRAQGQTHQRTVQEWERQKQQLQMEFRELLAIVEYLSDEIALEKRLGIAQLCLLLLVLVFIALTRGSRGEPLLIRHGARSSKWKDWKMGWNLSTDRLRSTSSVEGDISIQGRISNHSHNDSGSGLDGEFVFPQQKNPLASVDLNIQSTNLGIHLDPDSHPRKLSDHSRPRTPSFRRNVKRHVPHPLHLSPSTHHHRLLTRSKSAIRRPILQRSNSHNSEVNVQRGLWSGTPRSSRKSAKSAHLHEVVRTAPVRRNRDGAENTLLSAVDALYYPSSSYHRSQRTSSDIQLQPESAVDVFASDQKGIKFKGKEKMSVSRAGHKDMDGGKSDGELSAWEDTDSVPGELYDC